jgi:hypothetical protein
MFMQIRDRLVDLLLQIALQGNAPGGTLGRFVKFLLSNRLDRSMKKISPYLENYCINSEVL